MEGVVMNCTIVIEQKMQGRIKQSLFSFDDYRVATAIENLLCNMEHTEVNFSEYKEGIKK